MKVRLRFMKQYSHWKLKASTRSRASRYIHYVLKRYITIVWTRYFHTIWCFLAKLLNKNQTFGQPIWLSYISLPIDFHICLFFFFFFFFFLQRSIKIIRREFTACDADTSRIIIISWKVEFVSETDVPNGRTRNYCIPFSEINYFNCNCKRQKWFERVLHN